MFEEALRNITLPESSEEFAGFIIDVVNDLERQGRDVGFSPGTLGRIKGDWFEWAIAACVEMAFGPDTYQTKEQVSSMRAIEGFEFQEWIPCPDLIVVNMEDVRAVISVKWALRSDRRYEEPYVAMAIKRIKPWIKYLIVINDDQRQNVRMLVDSHEIDRVYHLRAPQLQPSVHGRLYDFDELIGDLALILKIQPRL